MKSDSIKTLGHVLENVGMSVLTEGVPDTVKDIRVTVNIKDTREGTCEGALREIETIPSAASTCTCYETKEFIKGLERRIEEKSRRIEIFLDMEESLQKEKSWERGLKIIVESMNDLGFERYGIFLVNPVRKTLEFHSGTVDLSVVNTPLFLEDSEQPAVQCVLEKRTVSTKENTKAEGNPTAFEPDSLVWVPIIVEDEAFATLLVYNAESTMTEEDTRDLETVANMYASFIDRTRILVEPAAEEESQTKPRYWLNPMEMYTILEERPKWSLEIFCELVTHGVPGFVISRAYPERVRKKYELVKTPMVWLSQSEIENSVTPDDLFKLQYVISDFTRKSKCSVIFLDGLEYLIIQNNFEKILECVQELGDIIASNNSRLIISLHKDTLSPEEYSMLEREVTILK